MIDLNKAFPGTLSQQERLLRYLDELGQVGYYIVNVFRDIEEELAISHSSLKRYLKDLQDADVLKYSLEQKVIMLNPKVFKYPFMTAETHYIWQAQYSNFIAA